MPYIGKSPVSGGFHKLGSLTASATATYALTLNGAAYFPETANQLLVSLNGVIQAPQDSFTVSGSNLIFDSALTASDSIDFVVALGDVLGVGSVTDGAVTTNKIANNAVTMNKLATSGTLPALDGSNLTNVGQVIGISTPTILRGDVSVNAGLTQLGSASLYYVSGTGILTNTYTKKSSTSIITAHWNVNYHQNTSGVGTHGFFCAAGTSGNTDTIIAMPQDFNRIIDDLSVAKTFSFSGSGPFVGLAAGSYDFIMGPVRGSDPGGTTGFRWNYREHGDQPANSLQTSYLYVTETEV